MTVLPPFYCMEGFRGGYRHWTRPTGVRVDGPKGPRVLKVLRFDSHYVAEGCGGGWRRSL